MHSVGRSTECNIVLKDHRSSRHHADLRWNGHAWQVVDQGSTNGTYVNGLQVRQPYDLRFGDRVIIKRRGAMLGRLKPHDLIETGLDKNDSGVALASTELIVHRAIYQATPALAVVHAHPRTAIAFSLSRDEIVLSHHLVVGLLEILIRFRSTAICFQSQAVAVQDLLANTLDYLHKPKALVNLQGQE